MAAHLAGFTTFRPARARAVGCWRVSTIAGPAIALLRSALLRPPPDWLFRQAAPERSHPCCTVQPTRLMPQGPASSAPLAIGGPAGRFAHALLNICRRFLPSRAGAAQRYGRAYGGSRLRGGTPSSPGGS